MCVISQENTFPIYSQNYKKAHVLDVCNTNAQCLNISKFG